MKFRGYKCSSCLCFFHFCGRGAVPLGVRQCDIPSGLLRGGSSHLSNAGLQCGCFNWKQGSNSKAYLTNQDTDSVPNLRFTLVAPVDLTFFFHLDAPTHTVGALSN